MLIGITVSLLLMILGFLFNKYKGVFILQCTWIWILTGLNNGGWDFSENELIYNISGQEIFTGLNGWLNNILAFYAHKLNLTYVTYNSILCIISVIILAYVILKNSEKPNFVMSLVMIYPLMDSVYQKRFYVAMCFIVLAYHFYFKKKSTLYYICIFLAIGFHFSVFIYLLYPLAENVIREKKYRIYICMLICTFLFNYLDIIAKILPLGNLQSKILTYTEEQKYSTIVVGILFLSVQYLYIFLVRYIWKKWSNKYFINDESFEKKVYIVNSISVILLPLLLIGSTYNRYYRAFHILNYIFLGNRIKYGGSKNKLSIYFVKAYIFLLILVSSITFLAGENGIRSAFESVYLNNIFLEWLNKYLMF